MTTIHFLVLDTGIKKQEQNNNLDWSTKFSPLIKQLYLILPPLVQPWIMAIQI